MKIYNTLTKKKEEFKTIKENEVKIYVCGPTVYNFIHIGNARPVVFFDTVRRYLDYKGYIVSFVMNLTDIDDKIIERANLENLPFTEITKKYSKAFMDNAKSLNVEIEKIKYPKATDHIDEMIDFVKGLENIKAAYDTKDTVYFSIDKAKDYGKLSKKKLEELNIGSRIEISLEKKSPADFALWKKQKSEDEPAWESPWGMGRPGWHLECSTMCKTILGDTIDIHGGGEDLQFPHHENEIAQSETLNNKPLANYWMHNAMITVDKNKMSKSEGNFFTLEDIQKEYDLIILRLWLLSGHYRSPIDFSKENLESIKNAYKRLENSYKDLIRYTENTIDNMDPQYINDLEIYMKKFENEMDDDFNTANALSILFEFTKFININLNEKSSKEDLQKATSIFDNMIKILGLKFNKEILDSEIEALISERAEARKNKNFKRADEIRDLLKEKGIELKDTRTGVTWYRV